MHGRMSLGLAVCTALLAATSGHAQSAARPNIVLLISDDQRWDSLGCAGHPHLKTPNIDRLAADGAMFPNAFVTTSICCISRASLMTGRLCRHHKVGDFQTPLPADVLETSLPALLKKAGYRTACFGKWGIGGPAPRDLFDEWDAWAEQGAFFHNVGGKRVHNSQFLADKVSAFLANHQDDRPFALIVCFKSPHDPYQPDPRDADLYRDVTFPVPKTADPEFVARQPKFLQNSLGRTRAMKDFPTAPAYQEFVRQYLRCIAGVDRSVGQIMATLEHRKMAANTVVLFTSDNGFFLGERGLDHKWLMHEESIRVPMIVRDPRLPADRRGQRPHQMALNIDVAPTLLELAGVAIPAGLDGRSLRPLSLGTDTGWRGWIFYEHHYVRDGAIPLTKSIRTT